MATIYNDRYLCNIKNTDVSQETFQRCSNIVFWLIWRRDMDFKVRIYNVEQCQYNVVYFNVDMKNVKVNQSVYIANRKYRFCWQ